MTPYRHGDCLLLPTGKVEGVEQKHSGQFILAAGEATGHHHRLTVKNPDNMKVYKTDTTLYVVLMEVGTLTHEEHKLIEIQPGTYELDMETEYDPFMETIRSVQD